MTLRNGSNVWSVIALPEGRLVSCSADFLLRVWNSTSGDCEKVLSGHSYIPYAVIALFSDGRRLVSCSGDSTLRVWNASTGECERVLSGHEGKVKSVIALPDGRIACYSEDKLHIWNNATSTTGGVCERVLSGHE
eukprot:gene61626-biopygen12531